MIMDQRIYGILDREVDRQATTIELIASENFASEAVMSLEQEVYLQTSTQKDIRAIRYYNGCEHMDLKSSNCSHRQHLASCTGATMPMYNHTSGANANTAVYQAFLKPGDTLLGMDLASGGHLSHGSPPTL